MCRNSEPFSSQLKLTRGDKQSHWSVTGNSYPLVDKWWTARLGFKENKSWYKRFSYHHDILITYRKCFCTGAEIWKCLDGKTPSILCLIWSTKSTVKVFPPVVLIVAELEITKQIQSDRKTHTLLVTMYFQNRVYANIVNIPPPPNPKKEENEKKTAYESHLMWASPTAALHTLLLPCNSGWVVFMRLVNIWDVCSPLWDCPRHEHTAFFCCQSNGIWSKSSKNRFPKHEWIYVVSITKADSHHRLPPRAS